MNPCIVRLVDPRAGGCMTLQCQKDNNSMTGAGQGQAVGRVLRQYRYCHDVYGKQGGLRVLLVPE
ncbi:MAG: hypothetical protein R6Y91_03230 [Desulfohalobium sp.]